MESRPQATAHVQNTRRTLGVDCRYQPVSDRSTATGSTEMSVTAACPWPDTPPVPLSWMPVPLHRRIRAPIDADVGAVDETRPRAGEEGDQVRQFLYPRDTAHWIGPHLGGKAVLPLRHVAAPSARPGDVADPLLQHRREHRPWGDGVDGDASTRQHLCQASAEHGDRRL